MSKKNLFFPALLALLVALAACDKLNDLLVFNLSYTSSVSISPAAGINLPFDIFTPEITTNAESTFASKGTSKDLIDKITLSSMKLNVTAPANQNLDFLNSVEFFISADSLSEVKIASATSIPDTVGTSLTLTPTTNDLAPFLKKDKFKIRVRATTDKAISRQVDINILSDYQVKAKIF